MESDYAVMQGTVKQLDREIEKLQGEANGIPYEIDALERRAEKIKRRIIGLVEQRNQLSEDLGVAQANDRVRKQRELEQIRRREEKQRDDQARLAGEAWEVEQNRKAMGVKSGVAR